MMHKLFCHACKAGATIFGTTLLMVAGNFVAQSPTSAQTAESPAQPSTVDPGVLEQVERYSNDLLNHPSGEHSLDQVTDVTQFRDVQPTDWAYEALRGLVERYGCIEGYPDQTYRGNRALTRYEFAAGLYSCLTQIERLIAATGGGIAPEDLEDCSG